MKRSVVLLVAAFLAASAAARASDVVPAPSVDNVGGVPIVRQSDPHGSLIGVEYVVRAGLDRQTLRQNGVAALAAQTILCTPVALAPGSGSAATMPMAEAVAAHGGSVHFTVDPDDVRFYIEALASDAPQVFDLFTQAARAPDFGVDVVRSARQTLTGRIAGRAQAALQVGLDMLSNADAKHANAGLPALGTAASLVQIFPSDVEAFYRTYYRRGGSVVSAVGRVDALAPDALATLAQMLPAGSTDAVHPRVKRLRNVSRQLIAHRDVASPWLIAQYAAPGVGSKDFGPMLVLSAFVQRTLADIAGIPGVVSQSFTAHAAGAVYSYDRSPARLVLYVNGAIGNPSRTFATALSIVDILAQTKLQSSIGEFKAMAAGDFATGATDLESRAWLAAVFAQQSSSPDFLDRALRAIAATTPEDVQRVARTYMGNPTIALVLPRDNTSLGQ